MRIVTWNINGLRACLRRRFNGKLVNLLNFLNAEIICLQETKIATPRVDPDLAFADGWESFFANCRVRGGYSGVATFCRAGSCMPIAALDGFSGVLPQSSGKPRDTPASTPVREALSNPCSVLFERFSQGELESLDSEGRVVITDHGAFVLVNVYGPAISTEESAEERYAFKLQFYKALLMRITALREAGRAVILLGDLNISLATIDSCDPGKPEEFDARADRRLLTQLLTFNGGPFLDTFRKFHPDRQEAYTCWSTASGARINNYGTRIDLILAAGPCGDAAGSFHAAVSDSDIWMDAHGSDHAPVYADLAPSLPISVGQVPPPLSSRYMYTGKQGNLKAWLASASLSQSSASSRQAATEPCATAAATAGPDQSSVCLKGQRDAGASISVLGKRPSAKSGNLRQKAAKQRGIAGQSNLKAFMKPQAAPKREQAQLPAINADDSGPASEGQCWPRELPADADSSKTAHLQAPQRNGVPDVSHGSLSQQFLCQESLTVEPALSRQAARPEQEKQSIDRVCEREGGQASMQNGVSCRSSGPDDVDELVAAANQWEDVKTQEGLQPGTPGQLWVERGAPAAPEVAEQNASAKAAWRQIQQRMKPPLCKGHSEPCVIRQVKKAGPNQGRVFFVCNRNAGKLPEGRCDFFQWEGDRQMRGGKAQASGKSVTLKGCWN